ncbi:putative transporter [Smittium mucronatum]|uniref:Putative transporter n=1 Tax=Smittium mucronatum TaxID=133383 RepID=A0A1R0H7H0_9FUNG|nr:putative transporter [Smittium mucronatum]
MFLVYLYLSSRAIAEVLIIGLCGYFFARRGTLDRKSLRMLSELSVQLLTPCLLYSNMVKTLNPSILAELWLTPVIYFFYGIMSFVWVYTSANVLRVDVEYCRLLSVAVFFANTNTLPVSLLNSILSNPDAEFMFRDPNDSAESMAARGVSYAIMFATFNNFLRWSLGTYMISGGLETKLNSKNSSPTTRNNVIYLSDTSTPASPDLSNIEQGVSVHDGESLQIGTNSSIHAPGSSNPVQLFRQLVPQPNSNVDSRFSLLSWLKTKATQIWKIISPCMTMPIYAILLASATVMFPKFKTILLDKSYSINVLFSAIQMCSDSCIPITILTLGGQLGQIGEEESLNNKNTSNSYHRLQSPSIEQESTYLEESTNFVHFPESSSLHKDGSANLNDENVPYTSYRPNSQIDSAPSSSSSETHIPSFNNSALNLTNQCSHNSFDHTNTYNHQKIVRKNVAKFKGMSTIHGNNVHATGTPDGYHSGHTAENIYSGADHTNPGDFINCNSVPTTTEFHQKDSSGNRNKGIFIVLVGRFMVVPLFAATLLVFLKVCVPNHVTLLASDPVFFFTLLILSATPPAINLITVVQSTGLFEDDAANLLMWGYLVGIFTISLEVGGFMYLTSILFV